MRACEAIYSTKRMVILDSEDLQRVVDAAQSAGRRLVFTNGVFDLMHVGHLRYLQEAREVGDALIVAVNSDASVRRLKGEKRPIVPQSQRAEMLDGLRCVDYVTIFDTDTPVPLVAKIKPAIYVKGGDYRISDLPEADVVHGYGGEVRVLSLFSGHSSTDLVETICARYAAAVDKR
jgi:rfaE bifunctional protein nucleotidyltransferase chain/domain